jgi:hypothetical protein
MTSSVFRVDSAQNLAKEAVENFLLKLAFREVLILGPDDVDSGLNPESRMTYPITSSRQPFHDTRQYLLIVA